MPTWVIVGASRGIGYQYLTTLARDPSNTVIGIVRTPSSTSEKVTADSLHNVHILRGDLTDSASLYAAAAQVSDLTNRTVDYLIINGVNQSIPTLNLIPGDYVGAEKEALLLSELGACMQTNVVGALCSINAFVPLLLNSGTKKVVCITSAAADVDFNVKCVLDNQLPYAMSKAALNILTAKFAVQYKEEGVKFLALSPGYVLAVADSMDKIPPQMAPIFESFTNAFKNLNPQLEGPSSMEESVDQQLKVIKGLTLEQSGQFLSHFGNKTWL